MEVWASEIKNDMKIYQNTGLILKAKTVSKLIYQ